MAVRDVLDSACGQRCGEALSGGGTSDSEFGRDDWLARVGAEAVFEGVRGQFAGGQRRGVDQITGQPEPKSSMWALVAYYLRFWRRQRKLTGGLMGEVLGGSKATVSRLESGDMRLDETRVKAIDREGRTDGIFSPPVWYATLGHGSSGRSR
ncbi:helix-turn-helix transcriptional regulator [Actinoallomurus sp. NPDC052274]|uniref:helix-turn-helix domain-containing protein n=1 Tax=Actinoallomurus sp. NPDC052274 TaxID=3155420 RepID=UPI003424B90E